MTNDHVTAAEKNLKKKSKKFVDRNENVVPLHSEIRTEKLFFRGQNPSRPPTRKISPADEKKSPRLERPAVSERKGEIQDNLIFNFQFSILN